MNPININIKISLDENDSDYAEMLRDDLIKIIETVLGRHIVPALVTSEIS